MRLYERTYTSRLMLGTALYPSPAVMREAIRASGSALVTVSLRREQGLGAGAGAPGFWNEIRDLGVDFLPNTAGCHTAREAVTTARMARELLQTNLVKLEVVSDDDTLAPELFGLVEAARALCDDGFDVLPYTTEDLGVAERLLEAGCQVLMPWGAPIGSGLGLNNRYGLRTLRERLPDVPMIVDAGLGRPSHAADAMELGFDGVLLNTAVASAGDPVAMARAFKLAVEAGRLAFEAGAMEPRDMAAPSTPLLGRGALA